MALYRRRCWIRHLNGRKVGRFMHTVNMSGEVNAVERRIFQNKRILLLALAGCVLEIVLSGRSISRAAPSGHDWIYTGGLLFSVWIVAVLALRTTISKERFLFALVSVAFVLWTAISLMLPSQQVVHILILLLWIGATVSGVAILLGSKNSKGHVR